ncbi:MAG: Ig-like domain-containing protein, partial [Candidatus Baltobacteraceae bacterium]
MQTGRVGFFILTLGALAACGKFGGRPVTAPLANIAELTRPSLPGWILEVSPERQAQTLSQIRVIFAKPIVPMSALESVAVSTALSHFTITPQLKGHFVLLTPRMVGFAADQALPRATRVRITLTSGLRDLAGDALREDLAWTFQTDPISLSELPQLRAAPLSDGPSPGPVALRPILHFTSNTELTIASLESHASLRAAGRSIGLQAELETEPTPPPGSGAAERFDPSLKTWRYALTPESALSKATTYALIVQTGVESVYGNVASTRSFTGAVRTYSPLSAGVVDHTSSADDPNARFAAGDPTLRFNNPIDPKSLTGNLAISPTPLDTGSLFSVAQNDSTVYINPYSLDPNTKYTVSVGAGLTDIFGQLLGNREVTTVTTDDFAPGFWAPGGNATFPRGERVALNLYATNLPGNRYRAYYRKLAPTDLIYNSYVDPGRAFIPADSTWPTQQIDAAKPNRQSVIPISLIRLLGSPTGLLA